MEEDTDDNTDNNTEDDVDSSTEYNNSSDDDTNNSSDEDEDTNNGINDDIKNVIFKKINGEYSWGKYGDFNVVMMNKNGYINVTKLCADAKTKTGKKKDFFNWKANSQSKALISDFSSLLGISRSELFLTIMGGRITKIMGTYAHPYLIPHIASWASTKFAVKVSKIVNEYYANKAIAEKEKLLQKKDDKIDKLTKNIKKQTTEIKTLVKDNKKQTESINKMDNRIKRLLKKNDEIYDINQEISYKIDAISDDRVIKGKKSDNNIFILIKNNEDPDEYDEDELYYEYYAIRTMKGSYNKTIMKYRERHPYMEIVLKINYTPNSVNLWKRIKERLRNIITTSGNYFNIGAKYTENKLVRKIKEIHNEILDHDNM